jgi:hypothetical protein
LPAHHQNPALPLASGKALCYKRRLSVRVPSGSIVPVGYARDIKYLSIGLSRKCIPLLRTMLRSDHERRQQPEKPWPAQGRRRRRRGGGQGGKDGGSRGGGFGAMAGRGPARSGGPAGGERKPFRSRPEGASARPGTTEGSERPQRRFDKPAGQRDGAPRPPRAGGERPFRARPEGERPIVSWR